MKRLNFTQLNTDLIGRKESFYHTKKGRSYLLPQNYNYIKYLLSSESRFNVQV